MLTNKILNANVDPSAIGGTYTWSAESCTCTTACADVSFTSTTGTVIGTNFSTTVTYPDDCTSIIIKLTIVTVEEGEQCVSTFYYNIVNEEPEYPSHLSEPAVTLLKGLLEKEPENRLGYEN